MDWITFIKCLPGRRQGTASLTRPTMELIFWLISCAIKRQATPKETFVKYQLEDLAIEEPKTIRTYELTHKINSILKTLDYQKEALINHAAMRIRNGNSRKGLEKDTLSFEKKCKKLKLTSREVEIAKLLKAGYTYKEDSERLVHCRKNCFKAFIKHFFESWYKKQV